MIDIKYIGKIVRKERRSKETTQKQLALRAGVTLTAISRLEKGVVGFEINTLEKIVESVGLCFLDTISKAQTGGQNESW